MNQKRLQLVEQDSHRRGMLLISVLICLMVVMLLAMRWVKLAVLERQQVRAQFNRMQAEYLAGSGLERARAQLAIDPAYRGETWRIDAAALAGRGAATVTIRVESPADSAPRQRVQVVADFPADSPARARRSREIEIFLPKTVEAP